MKVTPELRREILLRDGECVAAKLGFVHLCRDRWGDEHPATDLDKLSIEHVKDQLRAGKRAESDTRHLVALCCDLNVRGPSKQLRMAMREYLKGVNA